MQERKLISHDPATGTYTFYVDNPDDPNTYFVEKYVDPDYLQDMLDYNQAQYNAAPTSWGDGAVVARIPNHIFYNWKKLGYDDKKIDSMLNDPEFRKFRTRPGKI